MGWVFTSSKTLQTPYPNLWEESWHKRKVLTYSLMGIWGRCDAYPPSLKPLDAAIFSARS